MSITQEREKKRERERERERISKSQSALKWGQSGAAILLHHSERGREGERERRERRESGYSVKGRLHCEVGNRN